MATALRTSPANPSTATPTGPCGHRPSRMPPLGVTKRTPKGAALRPGDGPRHRPVVLRHTWHGDDGARLDGRHCEWGFTLEFCRERCWKRDWVVEFDIAKFFDSVPWDLLVKAGEAHTDAVWVKLYVRRGLAAPLVMPDGSQLERERGIPQGAPVSPALANLFLHYACTSRSSGIAPA